MSGPVSEPIITTSHSRPLAWCIVVTSTSSPAGTRTWAGGLAADGYAGTFHAVQVGAADAVLDAVEQQGDLAEPADDAVVHHEPDQVRQLSVASSQGFRPCTEITAG